MSNTNFIKNDYLPFADIIHKSVVKENADNNIHKILTSVDIYYNLLFFDNTEVNYNIYKRALKSLIVLMTHKYS
jgi:hypothetical protein